MTVTLRAGATLPSESGYGRFVAPTVTDDTRGIADAVATPLSNPATDCPTTTPVPVRVFLDSLTTCWKPRVDIRIAGWRDTLSGLCGCGPMFYLQKPAWLASQYGIGWLFAEPFELNLDDWFALYAPNEAALGADSGARPTYMEVTGHVGDDAAATCRAVPDPNAPPSEMLTSEEAKRITAALKVACAAKFVLTSVREVQAPESALSFCPPGDPLTVGAAWDWGGPSHLLTSVCHGGGEVAIRGWFDADTDPGGQEPSVSPSWLDDYAKPTLFSREGGTWENSVGFQLFVNPETGVALPTRPGWFVMTGHFDDPAAASCVRTDGGNAGNSWAEECRDQFVVTAVAPG